MGIKLKLPDLTELRPRITVIGVGGAGGNAVNNMVQSGLEGVEFIAANTDAQALSMSSVGCRIQMGIGLTEGLGAGSKPEIGAEAAEEALDEIRANLDGVHMLFITAGMGGGTGTGAAPVIAHAARELGILTVAVVTKPFEFEGQRRMRLANQGITELARNVDTIIVIPNQNLFRVATEKTTFADAFHRADDVLKSGVACITNLMLKEGLINLDFADVRVVMKDMGTAMMGTGEAEGEKRALQAAEAAISNPLLGEITMKGAKGLLVSITGGYNMTLYEVEEAASRIRREVDPDSNPDVNIIVGATFDPSLDKRIRVSVVATGIKVAYDLPPLSIPPEAVKKEPRLSERLYPPGSMRPFEREREKPAARPDNGPAWQGSGNVTIEPKQRQAPLPPGGPGRPQQPLPPQQEQAFQPAQPVKPLRPPRRPLTSEDFPELSTQEEIHDPDKPAGGSRYYARKGGFLDWVTGRKSRQDNDAPVHPNFDLGGIKATDAGVSSPAPGARPGEAKGAPPRRNETGAGLRSGSPEQGRGAPPSDESFDIPQFFKRPVN